MHCVSLNVKSRSGSRTGEWNGKKRTKLNLSQDSSWDLEDQSWSTTWTDPLWLQSDNTIKVSSNKRHNNNHFWYSWKCTGQFGRHYLKKRKAKKDWDNDCKVIHFLISGSFCLTVWVLKHTICVYINVHKYSSAPLRERTSPLLFIYLNLQTSITLPGWKLKFYESVIVVS